MLDAVLAAVREQTQNDQVTANTPLMDAGISSMNAVHLASELQTFGAGFNISPLSRQLLFEKFLFNTRFPRCTAAQTPS